MTFSRDFFTKSTSSVNNLTIKLYVGLLYMLRKDSTAQYELKRQYIDVRRH